MALVIKSWRADTANPDPDGNMVAIECRQEGVLAYLLTVLGISPISTIKVGPVRVEFTTGSLEGFTRRMIPLSAICSTYYGYIRPLRAAIVLLLALLFIAVPVGFALHPIAGVICFLGSCVVAIAYYLLNKKLTLGFVENSGVISGIQFKRSLIEGQKIEEEDARRVCALVQSIIEAVDIPVAEPVSPSGTPTGGFPVVYPPPASRPTVQMKPTHVRSCPKCGAQVGEARQCGVCGEKL